MEYELNLLRKNLVRSHWLFSSVNEKHLVSFCLCSADAFCVKTARVSVAPQPYHKLFFWSKRGSLFQFVDIGAHLQPYSSCPLHLHDHTMASKSHNRVLCKHFSQTAPSMCSQGNQDHNWACLPTVWPSPFAPWGKSFVWLFTFLLQQWVLNELWEKRVQIYKVKLREVMGDEGDLGKGYFSWKSRPVLCLYISIFPLLPWSWVSPKMGKTLTIF